MKRILAGSRWAVAVLFTAMMVMEDSALAQADMQGKREAEVVPTFFFDAICYSSDKADKSRVDVYIQVPYEELRFVKDGEKYLAHYDVTLGIANPNQQLLQERSWTVDVTVTDFSQTASNKFYSLSQRMLELDPGDYHLTVQLKDQDSRKTGRIKKTLIVTDFRKDSISLSDIMLVSRLSTDGGKKKIVPNISGNITSLSDGFFLFFEIYCKAQRDSLEFTWRILNAKKEPVKVQSQMEPMTGEKTQTFLKVEDLKLPVGSYLISIEARAASSTAEEKPAAIAATSRSFSVRWTDIPFNITDLDKAVEQMKYIARPSEFDFVREATEMGEKKKRFVDFWAKRDPDPTTPRNELMEEYYQRVDYANKNYSHYVEGWRTDMGMVYIRFGSPDNVERHPFDINTKPYEVWYYYQLERQFVFVDETGFGDYRLRYPTTDLWGRVR